MVKHNDKQYVQRIPFQLTEILILHDQHVLHASVKFILTPIFTLTLNLGLVFRSTLHSKIICFNRELSGNRFKLFKITIGFSEIIRNVNESN